MIAGIEATAVCSVAETTALFMARKEECVELPGWDKTNYQEGK